jgi:DNA-binding transcriptional MerR regulator
MSTNSKPTGNLLRISDAAKIVGVSDQTLRRWVDTGLIKCLVLPSGQRRFRQGDVSQIMVDMENAEKKITKELQELDKKGLPASNPIVHKKIEELAVIANVKLNRINSEHQEEMRGSEKYITIRDHCHSCKRSGNCPIQTLYNNSFTKMLTNHEVVEDGEMIVYPPIISGCSHHE